MRPASGIILPLPELKDAMPFIQEPRPKQDPATQQALQLARELRKHLQRKGIPVAGETSQAWSVSIKKLLSVQDPELVSKVLDWYGPRCVDPYLPQVRSGKTFLEKFPRLLERSGLAMTTTKTSQDVADILRREPLSWPLERKDSPSECDWTQDAYDALRQDLEATTKREQALLGPARHVLRRWRRLKNDEAHRVGGYNSFNDIRYRPGDDHTFRRLLWELKG